MGKIGYGSITLTDITESLPISLVLETNLNQNIQTKVGNLYTPDFTIIGEEEGLIITPSLFIGQEEINLKEHPEYIKPEGRTTGFIYYEINQLTNNQIFYKEEPERASDLFVDEMGRLHVKINLASNILIEAYILNFEEVSHGLKTELVQATNPISILFLEEGNNNYYAAIECENGREHFEERNANDIVMTAKLYQGIDDILNLNDYEIAWKKTSDGENTKLGSDKQYIVSRDAVSNRELFYCEIKDKKTGITYTAKQFIYDFQDTYRCDISYNKSLLINESNPEIKLTATAWNKDQKIAEIKENGNFIFKLSYRWILLYENNNLETIENILQEGDSNSFTLNYSDERLPKTSSFVIFCAVLNTDSKENKSVIASNAVSINYVPDYQIVISPKTIFVPTGNDGITYNGAETYTFSFKLVDKNGETLSYNTQDETNETGPSLVTDDGTTIDFNQEDESKWAFDGEIKLATDGDSLWGDPLLSSKAYEFSFVFFGIKMTEEINIVKSFAGEQGFSGYTVDLSPEFYAFSGGEGQATPNQVINLSASAFFGDDKLEITSIKIDGEDLLNKEIVYQQLLISAKKDLSEQLINISIKTQGQGNFLTAPGNIPFLITVKTSTVKEITFIKTFNYSINYNGSSFYLHLGEGSSIVYNKPEDLYVPQSITVYAKKISENGESSDYSNGVIMYKYNTSSNWTIASRTGFCSIENYPNNFSSIEIRLYGANIVNETEVGQNITSISTETLNESKLSKYLRAADTIPLVTSMEGYSIGGENLLRWTKEMPIETNKWSKSNNDSLTIEKDGEFSVMNFNFSATENTQWLHFSSPKIKNEEEFLNKAFCFSCYIKADDWSVIQNEHFTFTIIGLKTFDSTTRDGFRPFTLNDSKIQFSEEKQNNNWIKLHFTFKLTEDFFTGSALESPIKVSEAEYLKINFYRKTVSTTVAGNIQIKKPKLEMGNIPTDWNANPEDIDFSDIGGSNLVKVSNPYNFILKAEDKRVLIGDNLLKNTPYTISWQASSKSPGSGIDKFYWEICSTQGSSTQDSSNVLESGFFEVIETSFSYCFEAKEEDSTLFFYSKKEEDIDFPDNTYIILEKLKLEKGTTSTSFMMTPEQINAMAQSLAEKSSDNLAENIYKLPIIESSQSDIISFTTAEQWIDFINETNKNNGEIKQYGSVQEQVNKSYNILDGRLHAYEGRIVISAEDAQDPYISISAVKANEESSFQNYLKLTPTAIQFYSNGNIVAELQQEILTIENVKMNNSFSLGELLVKITEDNNVGFLWS